MVCTNKEAQSIYLTVFASHDGSLPPIEYDRLKKPKRGKEELL